MINRSLFFGLFLLGLLLFTVGLFFWLGGGYTLSVDETTTARQLIVGELITIAGIFLIVFSLVLRR